MDKATIICKCEEITYEEIEEVIGHGAEAFDDIKRLTRCGMGPCQSKVCSHLVSQVIHEVTGKPFDEIPVPRTRMPISPIKIETLATNSTEFSTVKSVLDELKLEDGRVK
ncbi:(2Fe-2S)-binding protein [Cytobacillus spongiae]|uniref:(2Fe-2S)-binding protein n=1 Tax=Cytobacillus spongiae TaxID=2901381 RepID=UPI001F3A476A|nr:(2Fe-2S)-binding protein [Cytobacillus spongiae]UII55656.1 (2Fe-2S)-binding protein [Cytobacillus spongiae]